MPSPMRVNHRGRSSHSTIPQVQGPLVLDRTSPACFADYFWAQRYRQIRLGSGVSQRPGLSPSCSLEPEMSRGREAPLH